MKAGCRQPWTTTGNRIFFFHQLGDCAPGRLRLTAENSRANRRPSRHPAPGRLAPEATGAHRQGSASASQGLRGGSPVRADRRPVQNCSVASQSSHARPRTAIPAHASPRPIPTSRRALAILEIGCGHRSIGADPVEHVLGLAAALARKDPHAPPSDFATVGLLHAPAEERVEFQRKQRGFVRPIFK